MPNPAPSLSEQDHGIAKNQKSYVCIHVFKGERPILLVSRADGAWCFLCGEMHKENASEYRVVGIGHIFRRDPTVLALMDLPTDWEAERKSMEDQWIRTPGNKNLN